MMSKASLQAFPYFVLTFAWTWSMWWGAVAAELSFEQPLFQLLYLLGVLGPLVGAAWLVRGGSPDYRREFIRRVCDPRGIAARWWFAVAGVAAGPALVGAAAAAATGATGTSPDYSTALVGAVVVFALVAGLAEEPGWRGAAADAWQARVHPIWAAIGIGALWALWHLPLYFIEGSYQYEVGFASVRFWLTSLALVQLSVLFLWLANGARGSILLAILAHAGFNVSGELVPGGAVRDVVAFSVLTAVTLTVIAMTRGWLRYAADPLAAGQPAR
jgi:uncharacterized protein